MSGVKDFVGDELLELVDIPESVEEEVGIDSSFWGRWSTDQAEAQCLYLLFKESLFGSRNFCAR